MTYDLVRLPRRKRVPLAAIGRRVGFAVGLVLFVTIVTLLDADGYSDSAGGTIGLLDALYFATVTVTTTGYGDITAVTDSARLASTILITPARILFLILVVGTTVEVLTDQSREFIATRRWRKRVRGHVVICGFGSTGRSASVELLNRGFTPSQIVVVDESEAALRVGADMGFVGVLGDATRTIVLEQAAVRQASAVVVTPNRDDAAVLVTLTVREMNPHAHIVTAGREQENLHLLTQGGANEVIDATAAVGRMLGLATTAPGAVAVLDDILDAGDGFELLEIYAKPGPLAPQVPAESTAVAVVRGDKRLTAIAAGADDLQAGDRLIVLQFRESD